MKAKLWLRISAIISLLFAVGHTLGSFEYWSGFMQGILLALVVPLAIALAKLSPLVDPATQVNSDRALDGGGQ